MDHTIIVRSTDDRLIGVFCTCSPGEMIDRPWAETMPLDELNKIAHDHIEATDRTPIVR